MLQGTTRADKVLLAGMVLAAVSMWFVIRANGGAAAPAEAVVVRAGKEVLRVSLARPGLYEVPLVRGEAVVEVAPGRVRMRPMPRSICPRGICSETGWISTPAQTIVCVPNLLSVRLTGVRDGAVDALAG
ncbi:MAG TPA: NusG domain II-containing protein [Firmicutes bacterium]|nr:NusG domain II-containing protein [Bacillota bacterium]